MAYQLEKEVPAARAATEKTESRAPAAKASVTTGQAKAASPATYVYVGPPRPFGVPLMPNAVLRGEPSAVIPALAPVFVRHPALRHLFVPVAGLAEARRALQTPGSGLAVIHRDIKAADAKARTA